MKKIISLGLGVQSTALYFMSSMGELPRADAAVFSDLGREKKGTYQYLNFIIEWQIKNSGIPIYVVKKDLYTDLLNKGGFVRIPAYTKGKYGKEGMLRRQCTGEYKIAVVDSFIRNVFYGIEPRKRMPKTEVWKGISYDEIHRVSIPKEAWKVLVHPFCGYSTSYPSNCSKLNVSENKIMRRYQIEQWFMDKKLPIPPKSSCVFCPYQSDRSWYNMKSRNPEDFEAACLVDESIRDSTAKGVNNQAFIHRSLQPLREIEFKKDAMDLFHGECSGNCHL